MSTTSIPIFGTDGQVHSIPSIQLGPAMAAGGKQVAKVSDPQGMPRWVPIDQVDTARDNGGKIIDTAPTDDELRFLIDNPGHAWIPSDAKFPNRPAGIYPTGVGNDWRSDPSYQQSPVDVNLAKHTLEYGAGSAALTATALAAPAVVAATAPTTQAVRQGAGYAMNWAEQQGPSVLRQAVTPVVEQAIKMLGPKVLGGAAGAVGLGAGYKILKSLGLLRGGITGE